MPDTIGFRKGSAFAEAVKAGAFSPGADGEAFVERVLDGHRSGQDDADRWCAAYSRGFLRGWEAAVFDHLTR